LRRRRRERVLLPVGPIDQEVVARVLEDYQRVQRKRAELAATLDCLAPAWGELRAALNEVNRVLGT
jgi:hypothetical protein